MSQRDDALDAIAEHFLNIDDNYYQFVFEGKEIQLKWDDEIFYIIVDDCLVGTTENKRRDFKEALRILV